MTYDELIAYFHTQSSAGAALAPLRGKAVAQSTVAGWKKVGIPEAVQAQYEVVTRGKLKAERPYRNGSKREARAA
jgi:hypothetical protein